MEPDINSATLLQKYMLVKKVKFPYDQFVVKLLESYVAQELLKIN